MRRSPGIERVGNGPGGRGNSTHHGPSLAKGSPVTGRTEGRSGGLVRRCAVEGLGRQWFWRGRDKVGCGCFTMWEPWGSPEWGQTRSAQLQNRGLAAVRRLGGTGRSGGSCCERVERPDPAPALQPEGRSVSLVLEVGLTGVQSRLCCLLTVAKPLCFLASICSPVKWGS